MWTISYYGLQGEVLDPWIQSRIYNEIIRYTFASHLLCLGTISHMLPTIGISLTHASDCSCWYKSQRSNYICLWYLIIFWSFSCHQLPLFEKLLHLGWAAGMHAIQGGDELATERPYDAYSLCCICDSAWVSSARMRTSHSVIAANPFLIFSQHDVLQFSVVDLSGSRVYMSSNATSSFFICGVSYSCFSKRSMGNDNVLDKKLFMWEFIY